MPELTLDDYLLQLRADASADVRRNAAFVLGRMRDPRVMLALLGAVRDADAGVRVRVAEALGAWHDDSVAHALQTLIEDADADVRTMAAQSLGHGGHHSGLEALLTAAHDADTDVRIAALDALGKLADARAAPVLSAALLEDDSLIRYQAQQSFLMLPPDAAQDALLTLLPTVREVERLPALIETVGRIGTAQALTVLDTFAAHEDESVQDAVVWAIEQIRNRL